MPEEKKKKPDEGAEPEEKKPDASGEVEKEKSEETGDKPKEGTEEKAADDKQADENGEGAEKKDDKQSEDKREEKPADNSTGEESKPDVPALSEIDKLKAENLRLKTQNEAMKIGFNPDVVEDAVVLAEELVKREGVEITAALQSIAKKYPDWKSGNKEKDDKSKGGFKIGADSSDTKNTSNDRLSQAFGIKKKDK